MKKLQSRWFVLMVVAICLSLQAAAQYSSTQCPTVYEQLVDLNKYWADQEVDFDILEQRICFEKHTDLIQLHLSLVEQHLRQKDVSDLSLGQQLKRKLGLNILRAYWKEGRFPINNHHPGQVVPYFIDDFGTACAVGHIVRETGFEDFAKKVQRENNYAYIEDMDYPELTAWAGEYGFEEEELRWVQPSYGSSVRFEVEYIEPTCGNSDGSIIVSVIGSFTSFDTLENAFFTWYQGDEPAGQPISYAKSLTNVPAGEYTLLVDAPNQNATDPLPAFKTFRLSNADGPSISAMTTAESCENEQDGAITIEVTSGVAPHSIQLFNLGPSYNFEAGSYNRPENFIGYGTSHDGLQGNIWLSSNSPPNYRVEITDANGCITYEEIGLATNRISVGASSWNNGIIFPDCGLGNGSINVSIFDEGLAGGLEYNWNTGDTGPSIQGIEAGEYAVTVVDDWGCQISEEFTISNSDGPTLDFSNVTSTPTSCPGVSDGQIQIDFVDGVPPYSIKWYKNEGGLFAAPVWAFKGEGTAFMPNYVITGLAGDPNNPDGPIAPPVPTYKVVVEDGEGCRSSYELTLQEASVFGLYDVEVFNNTSCSAPNGSIVLSSISCIPNGCAEVRWEDGVVGGTRSNLATGSYGYAIVNACNGDTLVSTSAYVGGENVSIGSVEAGYASCGASNGWAEVILNTNEDLDFNWSHSTTLNSSVAENLAPGDYQVTVTGENGCSVVRSFTIYELPGVIFNDASTQVSNPASPGAADGSIKVEASSGDGTISYSWSHNASLDANQALNLSSGQYFITATSDGGCSDVITLTLSASSCTVTPDDILCRPWVQNYLNTNYPCNDGQCGSINLYTSPTGECVVDFVGEQPCLLAACPSHEVFDLDGNLLESYVSECGLEDLGYTNRQLVWSCGQAVCPEPVDCPNDPGEVLCLDWLSDEIQGLDCETCPYDASSAVTHGIYVADLNGTEGIVVRTQCGFNYLHRRFFDCEGTLLYDCFEEGLTLCSDWNDGIVLGDQLWDCSQPLPDCSTTPSPLPDQAEVIYSDPGLWGVTNAIFFNDEIHYAIGKDPMSNFPGYPNPNSNFGKLTLCNSSGEIHEYESESVASNAIHGDMAINPDGNLACVYQAPTGTGYGFRLPYKEWDG